MTKCCKKLTTFKYKILNQISITYSLSSFVIELSDKNTNNFTKIIQNIFNLDDWENVTTFSLVMKGDDIPEFLWNFKNLLAQKIESKNEYPLKNIKTLTINF